MEHFDKDKPVSLIDLGVGPAIKPVSIYTTLNNIYNISHFPRYKILAYDSSVFVYAIFIIVMT